MVSLDRSENLLRPSSPRDVPGNWTNYVSEPDDEREDVGIRQLHPPACSASLRRGSLSKMEFIAPQPGSTRGTWWQPIHDYATSTFGHIVEVVDNASNFERQLFFAVLGITVVWFLFSTISFMVSFTRPITPIPFYHCEAYKEYQTRTRAGRPVYWADYPKLVDLQANTFNQLLDESVDYEEFAQEVKNAERVSNNLIILVGMSDLSSKNEIAERLSKLVEEMRVAGRSLHSFGGKIQGAVDSIAILNEYALQTIEASRAPPSLAARMLPFPRLSGNPVKKAVMETFHLSMKNIVSQTVCLRGDAVDAINHLNALHGVIHQGSIELKAARGENIFTELLGSFWNKPDVNPFDLLKGMDLVLDSLRNVENHRRNTLANVVGTMQTLRTLDADMEELRKRVAVRDIVGEKIPIEMHIRSIKAAADRLRERQAKAT